MSSPRSRPGYTLIEVIVVIAVLGILVGLFLGAVQKARQSATKAACANNVRQIGLALHQYHDNHARLPSGVTLPSSSERQELFMSWMARILPYVEQAQLWDATMAAYTSGAPFNSDPPHVGLSTVVKLYGCPADGRLSSVHVSPTNRRVALSSYLGVGGTDSLHRDGVLYNSSRMSFSKITDGLSCTLVVGERPPSIDARYGWWYGGTGMNSTGLADSYLGVRERNLFLDSAPTGPYHFVDGAGNPAGQIFHFWSLHSGGANFAFADGSVRFLTYSADSVLPALATRAGGEVVALPD